MKEVFEKIKERLEKEKSGLTTWAEDEAFKLGIEKAQNIVSEVEAEYADDVCEWKWGIDRAMVQCKGDYIIFESRRLFSFCPYCGKKIKEAER